MIYSMSSAESDSDRNHSTVHRTSTERIYRDGDTTIRRRKVITNTTEYFYSSEEFDPEGEGYSTGNHEY